MIIIIILLNLSNLRLATKAVNAHINALDRS